MINIVGKTFADVYRKLLDEVYRKYQYETAPRGLKIREILNCSFTIENPYSNLFKNKVRDLPLNYLKKELALYFSGRRDVEGFEKASKFWKHIANFDNTVNSAYGYLIFVLRDSKQALTQWEWAVQQLENDKDTRQAIMHFNRVDHQYNGVKDFPCTLELTFHIRENKLNLSTVMRSNDVIKGTTFDVPFFMLLQQTMLCKLREEKYPDLKMGKYEHLAHSMHLYESDYDLVDRMLKEDFIEDKTPIITHSSIILNQFVKDISYGATNITEKHVFKENNDLIHWLAF